MFAYFLGPVASAALGAGIGWLVAAQPRSLVVGGTLGLFVAIFAMPTLIWWIWRIDHRRIT